ncbi:hypothetical protein MNB_SV-3-980 [hydrothermal vent metagenome]|uniref:L,D-TPase catalytic domain-containing protein n=1 Tax=hydrothermal vent metagenome TaxID=652676 RepID=A0A1W1BST2_9ZZZZ
MKIKSKSIFAVVAALLFTGCVHTPNKEGWNSKQSDEFLEILKTDKYLSVCDDKVLAQQVLQNPDSLLMRKMLVAYTNNLANGCIDLPSFNAVQKSRNSIDFSSKYTTYLQKVNAKTITMQLKAGQSIEQILKPYIPEYYQFDALLKQYRALQKSPETSPELLHKIRLNIERLKLMKPGLGKNYALVNIPEFKVRIIEDNKTSLVMRVITGKRNKQTPVFSADLQFIVLNPTWNVPDSIARHEIIPKALRNPNYLKRHRLVMRRNYNLDSPAVKFDANLSKAYVGGKGAVPFKFIEVASSHNALGRVKFLFPNENAVYMHDTPTKWLFKKKVRAFSHGCVRLGEPMKMMNFLAANYSHTTMEQLNEEYKSKKTHYIPISKHLPVHTAYLTTYVAEDGKLHLFNDIYGYDKLQKFNF